MRLHTVKCKAVGIHEDTGDGPDELRDAEPGEVGIASIKYCIVADIVVPNDSDRQPTQGGALLDSGSCLSCVSAIVARNLEAHSREN